MAVKDDGPRARLTTLPQSVSRLSTECGSLDVTQTYGPPWPVKAIALILLLLYEIKRGSTYLRNFDKLLLYYKHTPEDSTLHCCFFFLWLYTPILALAASMILSVSNQLL
jgi:hypothetical protein